MRHVIRRTALTLTLTAGLAAPAMADSETQDGFSLMEEGARLLFRGLMDEVAPALKDLEGLSGDMEMALRGFAQHMGPGLADLLEQVEDFSAYHPPEILPNGDIILRRKAPKAPDPREQAPAGDVEL